MKRGIANDSGQAITELVVISPIILLVIVALVSLTQAAQKQAAVTRAAAVAARVAVVRPDLAAAEARAALRAADDSIPEGDVQTVIEPLENGLSPFSRPARVKVSYKYRPITGFGWRPTFHLHSEFIVDQYNNAVWFNVPGPP